MKRTNVIKLEPDKHQKQTLRLIGDRVSALWNTANFVCRQALFHEKKIPSYSKLCTTLKDHKDYKALPSHIAQEVLKKLSKAWKGYFKLVKQYKQGERKDKPGLPHYRKNRKSGSRPFDYIPIKSTNAYSIKNGYLNITLPSDIRNGRLSISWKGILRYRGDYKTCELKYNSATRRWYAHVVVNVPDPKRKSEPTKIATGDIGAKRAIATAIQDSRLAHVFSAREMWKDYKYWSRRIAKEQSRLSQQGLKTSRLLKLLYQIRRLRYEHALESLSKKVVLMLKKNKVTHFKVGYPINCREEMNFGKNNALVHNFWSFDRIFNTLEKHCIRRGISFERIPEDGTSDVCHVCGREVKRPVRSVIVCPEHGRFHADVNASLNMLFKNTPGYGDRVEATPAWVTYEWNKHSWLPRARSLRYLSQVLKAA